MDYRGKSYQSDSEESDTEMVDVDKLPPLDVGNDEHKLQYTYCMWYHRGSYKIKTPMVSAMQVQNKMMVSIQPTIDSRLLLL